MNRQRIFNRNSYQEQKSRDARLRGACLAMCSLLRSRPNPRGKWDSVARKECPTAPWEPTQELTRSAMSAAVATGSPHLIAETRKKIEAFYAQLTLDALAVIPEAGAVGVLHLCQRFTIESAESNAALQQVIAEGNAPAMPAIEAAIKETSEAEGAAGRCLTLLNSILHRNARPALRVQA